MHYFITNVNITILLLNVLKLIKDTYLIDELIKYYILPPTHYHHVINVACFDVYGVSRSNGHNKGMKF